MIEVSVKLEDTEIGLFHDFLQIITARREVAAIEPADEVSIHYSPVEPGEEPAPMPVKQPTLADLEEAVKRFYKAKKLPATQKLLADFGAKKVSDVAPERYGEFLVQLNWRMENDE